ncbi:zinc finger, CCHC-type containing protein [Tanacetum coccineum]
MDHLFNDFEQKGINAFRDNNDLPRGEYISPQLYKAIEESRFLIVIFSKDYASSSWCLRELVKILECKKIENPKYEVRIIFYDVKPNVVRKQTGSYAEAFAQHDVLNRAEVGKWKEALCVACDLSGFDLQEMTNGYETKFIDNISKEILKVISDGPLDVAENLVSVDARYPRDMTTESGDTSKKEVGTISTPQFQCPTLKPSNYSLWAIRMQIILEANSLWEMIEPNEKTQADKTAIAFLYQALPEEQQLQITRHKTAKAIWDALKTRHIREKRVQQVRLQTLKSEFELLYMKEDETIDTFTTKLTTLVNKAASLGHTMEDETLVRKLLNAVPDRYLQIVASIEQYSDLDEMTLEEAIGRLKTYKERIKYKKGKQVDNQEKLMFTRHENKGKYFRGRGRGRHKFSQGRNHENFKEDRKDGETSHRSYDKNNFKKSTYDTSKVKCYKCKKLWHIAPNCHLKTRPNEQSNLVEEDLEPTLLMAILEVEEQEVSLHEENVGYKETKMNSLWYLDNGTSNHMTGIREYFKELDEKVSGKVRFGYGSYIEIKGKGSIIIECDDEKQRIISHVYYIPDLKSNLLSLGQFTEIGCKVVMEDDELRLYDMDNQIFMKITRQKNRLYKANLRIGTPVCLLANLKEDTWLWHARLGHLNFESLKSMAQRDLVHGIPAIKHTTQICDVCLIGKHSRAPFPKKAKARSTSPLDLVYGDLCGPITPPTPSGKKYIFLLVDDYSRYMWAYFLSTKDQAFDTFKEFKKSTENELRTTLKMLRTDRGGEFTSNEFTQYCKENGIARQLTAPYSPQQNGVVERRNRTIMSTTRCMMKATNMPQNFWAEAVRHAIYILNSVPTKALEDITPYEAIKQRKPNLENLRIFGCIAYAKVPSQHLTKLDDRSIKMVYLGNEQGSKAYRLFDPTTQRVCVSRDVKFKENETWDWKDYIGEHTNDEPEWTNFNIGDPEVTNEHIDQETQPNEDDNEFPDNNDDDDYASPNKDSPSHSQTPHTPSTRSSKVELLISKKSDNMPIDGAQELNYVMESLVHRIQHGNNKRADKAKLYNEIRNVNDTLDACREPAEPDDDPDPSGRYGWNWRPNHDKRNKQRQLKLFEGCSEF